MTVGMNRLNQMFRDFKVAEDVGKMMELRRFEVEFEIFGTVYWQDGKRHYLVSKSEDTLYYQLEPLALQDTYPLALQTWHESALVPAGWDEEIEQTIKVHFCHSLHDIYPEGFWHNIEKVTEAAINDSATQILDPLQDLLDGVFDSDQIQLFEGLLNRAYLRRNLTRRSYQMYAEWLREIRQEMVDDVVTKDVFNRELYGFAYQAENGKIQYYLNASQRLMHEKQEKHQKLGHLVTPIFQKKYWYNYDYRLDQVRVDFRELLKQLFNEEYFNMLSRLAALNVSVDTIVYNEILAMYHEQDNVTLMNAWENLGYQWGIFYNK